MRILRVSIRLGRVAQGCVGRYNRAAHAPRPGRRSPARLSCWRWRSGAPTARTRSRMQRVRNVFSADARDEACIGAARRWRPASGGDAAANKRVPQRIESRSSARSATRPGAAPVRVQRAAAMRDGRERHRAPARRARGATPCCSPRTTTPSAPGRARPMTALGVATLLEVARAIRKRQRLAQPRGIPRSPTAKKPGSSARRRSSPDEALLARRRRRDQRRDARHVRPEQHVRDQPRQSVADPASRERARTSAGELVLLRRSTQLLPNDTDVTMFKRAGKAAVNFAAIGGVNWYHTRSTTSRMSSPRTLQHHGDNALAALRASRRRRPRRPQQNRRNVLRHPRLLPACGGRRSGRSGSRIVSLVLLVFAARKTPPREMTFGVLDRVRGDPRSPRSASASPSSSLMRLRSADVNCVARPIAGIRRGDGARPGSPRRCSRPRSCKRRKTAAAMLYGVAIVWHMIGIALALALPGDRVPLHRSRGGVHGLRACVSETKPSRARSRRPSPRS